MQLQRDADLVVAQEASNAEQVIRDAQAATLLKKQNDYSVKQQIWKEKSGPTVYSQSRRFQFPELQKLKVDMDLNGVFHPEANAHLVHCIYLMSTSPLPNDASLYVYGDSQPPFSFTGATYSQLQRAAYESAALPFTVSSSSSSASSSSEVCIKQFPRTFEPSCRADSQQPSNNSSTVVSSADPN
jgi:hypothetical protein